MKTKPPDLDTDALVRLVENEYGLVILTLSFLPVGEDSFAFVAKDSDGARHFLRLEEDTGQRSRLENAYVAVESLARGELLALVAPCRTRYGGFLAAHGPFLRPSSRSSRAEPSSGPQPPRIEHASPTL